MFQDGSNEELNTPASLYVFLVTTNFPSNYKELLILTTLLELIHINCNAIHHTTYITVLPLVWALCLEEAPPPACVNVLCGTIALATSARLCVEDDHSAHARDDSVWCAPTEIPVGAIVPLDG